ncbi:MAG: hypothetical protein ABIY50_04335 [Ignavibacteria bacterium]
MESEIVKNEKTNFIKRFSLIFLILLFLLPGINHFRSPETYYPIIPAYIPNQYLINILSGLAEILFSVLLIFRRSRNFAVYSLIVLLILFIPAHIYHITITECSGGKLCLPLLFVWIRLLIIHPLLIIWVWTNRK